MSNDYLFVRLVDGYVVVGMALLVNKNELQSLKDGLPRIYLKMWTLLSGR